MGKCIYFLPASENAQVKINSFEQWEEAFRIYVKYYRIFSAIYPDSAWRHDKIFFMPWRHYQGILPRINLVIFWFIIFKYFVSNLKQNKTKWCYNVAKCCLATWVVRSANIRVYCRGHWVHSAIYSDSAELLSFVIGWIVAKK